MPQVWEKEIVLRSFFSKFGIVTGVTLLGFKQYGVQRFVISFKVRLVRIIHSLLVFNY